MGSGWRGADNLDDLQKNLELMRQLVLRKLMNTDMVMKLRLWNLSGIQISRYVST